MTRPVVLLPKKKKKNTQSLFPWSLSTCLPACLPELRHVYFTWTNHNGGSQWELTGERHHPKLQSVSIRNTSHKTYKHLQVLKTLSQVLWVQDDFSVNFMPPSVINVDLEEECESTWTCNTRLKQKKMKVKSFVHLFKGTLWCFWPLGALWSIVLELLGMGALFVYDFIKKLETEQKARSHWH